MLVLGGQRHSVPDVSVIDWVDRPDRVARTAKVNPRTRPIRAIFAHTVHGRRSRVLKPGGKPSDLDFLYNRSIRNSTRKASWDFTVDLDGSVVWQNDPLESYTWHAGQVNAFSIGFEMVTEADGTMYEDTIRAAARMVVFLCEQLGIQKQTAWDDVHDRPEAGRIARLDPGRGGADCVGVFGHRNVWKARSKDDPTIVPAKGFGDPNDYLFQELVNQHRFERFSFVAPPGQTPEDQRVWKERQQVLGFTGRDVDGIPLTKTVGRLKEAGYPNGIWVDRA